MTFGTYGLLAVIGCLTCAFIFCFQLTKRKLSVNDGILFIVAVVVGVFLGGHLLFGITNIRHFHYLFERVDFSIWLGRFSVIFGGAVFYGGLYGGLATGALAIKILRLDAKVYVGLFTPMIPLFHAFGRVGCFFAGCCYGIESDFGFAATENAFVPDVVGVTRFPIQLLEAALNILLFVFLFLLYRRQQKKKSVLDGGLFYLYLVIYGVIRFFDEFLRGDAKRGFLGPLSTSQWISIIGICLGSILLYRTIRKNKNATNDAVAT